MRSGRDEKPSVLVVDDQADDLRSGLKSRLDESADVEVLHPSGIRPEDLEEADLLLVDYRLDHWPERDTQPVAFNVRTGMALATILREAADEKSPDRFTAVALHTAHLSDASVVSET